MQLPVMNNAVFMEEFVTMESASSAALTMQATRARTAPHYFLVFQFVKMCWKMMHPGNIVLLVTPVYCSNWKKWLSCQTTIVCFLVVLGSCSISLAAATVMQQQND